MNLRESFRLAGILALTFWCGANASADGSVYELSTKWKKEDSSAIELSRWKGKWVVISMMYTSCQGSCPLIVQKMRKIEKLFQEHGKPAEFVLVSFDPKRDTPAALASYRRKIGISEPNWTFLSGTDQEARRLSMLLSIKYAQDPETGQVMHDNKIILLDPSGKIRSRLEQLNQDETELLRARAE